MPTCTGIRPVARKSEAICGTAADPMSRSLSSGARPRDPLAHAGYDHQTQLRVLATAFARVLEIRLPPERKREHATLKRGRGEDRVHAAPAVPCAKVE
jgi:hypothetical protein